MLYITTRSNAEEFTAHKALRSSLSADGGRYVPFRMPHYETPEILQLKEKSFNQIIADILNLFFSSRITSWDVDCCIGRNISKLYDMSHKIIVAELWHNTHSNYSYIVSNLYKLIAGDADTTPSDWFTSSVRIAVLFGLYGELLRMRNSDAPVAFDISVPTDDFAVPMAAWYARKMGLPIDMIICTGNEDSTVWDFIHRGTFAPQGTNLQLQQGMERLIHATLGQQQVEVYRNCCENGQQYFVNDELLKYLSCGIFCSVAGDARSDSTINSVFRSNHYLLDPITALCHGGLQDYRAKTGESRTTVLLAEEPPLKFASDIERATGIAAHKLSDYIHFS